MERLLGSLPSARACSLSGLGTLRASVPGIAEAFSLPKQRQQSGENSPAGARLLPSDKAQRFHMWDLWNKTLTDHRVQVIL